MQTKLKKKTLIVVTSILVGTATIGTTAYAVKTHNYNQNLSKASVQIKEQQGTLEEIFNKLNTYKLEDGFLAEGATIEGLESIKSTLNSVKDSHSDFLIEKDDLESDIKVLKLDKKNLKLELNSIESKLTAQTELNNFFESPVIVGSTVTEQVIKQEINKETITAFRETYSKQLSHKNKWSESINSQLVQAEEQLNQVDQAGTEVSSLITENHPIEGVTREAYEKAKTEVDKIKNETIKSELNTKLDEVMKSIEANEQRAKEEEQTRQQEEQASQQTQSSNSSNSGVVTNGGSVKSSGGSSSTNNYSTPKSSTQQPKTSQSTTQQPKQQPSSPSPQQPSAPSSSGGNTSIDTSGAKKTGEGVVVTPDGDSTGANTWEKWTVDGIDPSIFGN